jgi:hypothetical protein
MELASNHKMSINPEEVRRDNSNVWRYSKKIFLELRKEKFHKAMPQKHIQFCDFMGELALYEPFNEIDFKLDLETFRKTLGPLDKRIFDLVVIGLIQEEIKEVVGISQPSVSKRLAKIRESFKEFYCD